MDLFACPAGVSVPTEEQVRGHKIRAPAFESWDGASGACCSGLSNERSQHARWLRRRPRLGR